MKCFEHAHTLFPLKKYKQLASNKIIAIKWKLQASISSNTLTLDNKQDIGPITDDALRNQVLYQTRWNYTGNPRRLRDFKTVYVYRDPTYYEKTKKAFEGLTKVIYLNKLD